MGVLIEPFRAACNTNGDLINTEFLEEQQDSVRYVGAFLEFGCDDPCVNLTEGQDMID